ncbi:hypothetical protein HTT03_13745 [Sulfitobacter sp. S0837]|uniref:hypothetical protein n=1 Tax=Sulfitobacter maritimus TaxID=2741719 RepID=UPI001581D397|nr:hypothetical protein [Sulfitobacter maritimus]NUH66348.1 hypothetical protein [Sulfitobacter maritimus]
MRSKACAFLALAIGAPAAIAAEANVICEGTYEFFNGKDTVIALPGHAPPNGAKAAELYNAYRGEWLGHFIGKPKSEGIHEVKVSQCGRQFILSQGAKQMLFLQSIMDDTLYVAQDIGTNDAELTLRVVDHKIMVGEVAGVSHGFAFNIPVALDPRDVTQPDMTGCADEPAAEERDLDRLTIDPDLRNEAIDIVATELGIPAGQASHYISAARTVAKTRQSDRGVTVVQPGEPGCPIELTGVKTCRIYPPDTSTIVETNVLLDDEGRLLPVKPHSPERSRVEVDDPLAADICAPVKKYPPASTRLRFKFLAIEEDGINDVQTMLVDANTDRVQKAHYAEGTHRGKAGRAEAAKKAYEAVGSPVSGQHELP